MDPRDRKKIQKNLVHLSKLVNVGQLSQYLIDLGVIDHDFVERIQHHPTSLQRNQEWFLLYTKRGPKAFPSLVQALRDTGHISEAQLLAEDDEDLLRKIIRRPRASSLEIESPSESESSESSGVGVQPIFGTPGSSSSGLSSNSSGNEYNKDLEASPSTSSTSTSTIAEPGPRNTSPSQAFEQLKISANGFPTPPMSPINRTPIKKATSYNQGKLSEEDAYPMMSTPRGYALIINNINFPSSPEDKRNGAEHDSENLCLLFEELGFKTTVRFDMTRSDIVHHSTGILKKFSDQFRDAPIVDACIIAIMSHGTEEHKIRTCDPGHTYLDLYDDVIKPYNNAYCPQLRSKPKIFIVQACRGEYRDRGIRFTETDGKKLMTESFSTFSDGRNIEYNRPRSLPSFEDILVCYPTIPGYVANRDTERGTWYIQCLVEAFREFAHELEITHILRKIGLKLRVVQNELGETQMSSFKNIGFHRELYLNPHLFSDANNP